MNNKTHALLKVARYLETVEQEMQIHIDNLKAIHGALLDLALVEQTIMVAQDHQENMGLN